MSTQELYSPMERVTAAVGVGGVRQNRLVAAAADNSVVEAGATSQAVVGVSKYTEVAGAKTTVERGLELEVIYAAAANKGDALIPAAGGEVTPVPLTTSAGASPTAAEFIAAINQTRAIIGFCTRTQPAPGLGRAFIDRP